MYVTFTNDILSKLWTNQLVSTIKADVRSKQQDMIFFFF